ncbi:uncharacterized [Tachysurus ichikawai]
MSGHKPSSDHVVTVHSSLPYLECYSGHYPAGSITPTLCHEDVAPPSCFAKDVAPSSCSPEDIIPPAFLPEDVTALP